jgi:hypothetical protein
VRGWLTGARVVDGCEGGVDGCDHDSRGNQATLSNGAGPPKQRLRRSARGPTMATNLSRKPCIGARYGVQLVEQTMHALDKLARGVDQVEDLVGVHFFRGGEDHHLERL